MQSAPIPLTRQQNERYSRHLLLPEIGLRGQQRLLASRVLVIGAGGLGAPILQYLAAAGVGCIGIVEFDTVDLSNLQRQVLYRQQDVGQSKLTSAADFLRERHPDLQLELHHQRLEPSNAVQLISQYDLVLDGSDNFATRYLVNDACVLADKPYVWGSIYRFEGQVSVFWENAPNGRGVNYRDLYPQAPPAEFAPSCAEGGVLGVLCGVVGSLMATEAVKFLCGVGDSLLGHLLTYDALQMRFRKLPIRRGEERVTIRDLSQVPDAATVCTLAAANKSQQADMNVQQLHAWRKDQIAHILLDIRTAQEREIVQIADAQHMPQAQVLAQARAGSLPRDCTLVLHCKSGARSQALLSAIQELGYTNAKNLTGGILAWVEQIEPHLARY